MKKLVVLIAASVCLVAFGRPGLHGPSFGPRFQAAGPQVQNASWHSSAQRGPKASGSEVRRGPKAGQRGHGRRGAQGKRFDGFSTMAGAFRSPMAGGRGRFFFFQGEAFGGFRAGPNARGSMPRRPGRHGRRMMKH